MTAVRFLGCVASLLTVLTAAPPQYASHVQILLDVRPTLASFQDTLGSLSRRSRVPFGIETFTRGDPAARDETVSGADPTLSYDLTPLSLASALDRCATVHVADRRGSTYEWRLVQGVYEIHPQGFTDKPSVALNRRVPVFSGQFGSVAEALAAVHRIFDPSYRQRRPIGPTHEPDRLRSLIERPLQIKLANVTVREILDELVRQHGAMIWRVEYRTSSGLYNGAAFSFIGFDGWSVVMEAEKR